METKRIERLLIVVIALLLVNIAVSFRPFQFFELRSSGAFGVVYRCNVYSGSVTLVTLSGGEVPFPSSK